MYVHSWGKHMLTNQLLVIINEQPWRLIISTFAVRKSNTNKYFLISCMLEIQLFVFLPIVITLWNRHVNCH